MDIPEIEELKSQEIPQELQELPQELQEEQEQKIPKKRGRPAGSKNKEPGKPRAKRVVVQEQPIVTEAKSTHEEVPRVLQGSRAIPREPTDSKEALMLRLLTHQARSRQERKVATWKSWFH